MNPLYLSFIWHMHQPFYRDPLKGTYILPWVRLHGTKDYLDMVSILDEYPRVRQNFNLVPSLLEQLIDYIENNAGDEFLNVTLKDPTNLSYAERVFVLENFFLANWHTMIKPFPRYNELLQKRGYSVNKEVLSRSVRYFSDQDIRDLQTLFNLVWIDPSLREIDKGLKELTMKGSNFTEEEKHYVIKKQFEILRAIIPKYKEVFLRGQIELSVSPFYHPILPLLYDTNSAMVSSPNIKLPAKRFSAPEDVEAQVRMALEYFESIFGKRPSGLWPSEGAISEEVLRILVKLGIRWCASDEEVLGRSKGIILRDQSGLAKEPSILYRPHFFEEIGIIFRDHRLSDLIGFVYSGWKTEGAVEDLITRLKDIHSRLDERPYLVSIIMDGENAWEYYPNDGRDFLNDLYRRISSEEWIETITISEYLDRFGEIWKDQRLNKIVPGSWINANFNIWIGHEEDNLAWEYLKEARDELIRFERENPEVDTSSAWKLIYIAEGSDWNWWYGDEHVSETQEEFDELFRNNLIGVYKFIGKEPPTGLLIPILKEDRAVEPSVSIKGFITPRLDGFVSSYFEWLHAASIDVSRSGGSMHKTETLIERVYYGFDRDNLYIRLDGKTPMSEYLSQFVVIVKFIQPDGVKFMVKQKSEIRGQKSEFKEKFSSDLRPPTHDICFGIGQVLEIAIPFSLLGVKENDEIGFIILLGKADSPDEVIERIPLRGHIKVTVPGPYFEAIMWQV